MEAIASRVEAIATSNNREVFKARSQLHTSSNAFVTIVAMHLLLIAMHLLLAGDEVYGQVFDFRTRRLCLGANFYDQVP